MRLMSLDRVTPGMRLARPIHGPDGQKWLARGVELTSGYIDRLMARGIMMIYVEDDATCDVDSRDVISDEIRARAINVTREILDKAASAKFSSRRHVIHSEVYDIVGAIIDELRSRMRTIVSIISLKSYDNYTYEHSVNCAVLGMILGIGLDYSDAKLRNLGIGLLMHDIGKMRISKDILNKAGALDPWEFQQVKAHPELGFEILSEDDEVCAVSRAICLQHHERCDGSGYPRRLTLESIQEFSRVAAVVDVYDALTSDRIYRRAYLPSEALQFLKKEAGKTFDARLVQMLFSYIPPYPIGTLVSLSTGDTAVVVDINGDNLERPVVRILHDAPSGKPHHEGPEGRSGRCAGVIEIDLSRHRDITILHGLRS
ncbi:MAG TPA: HD-GYP domain-containing protein [Firmicutes bacterium]|nr:HD-GYP domain-containing protein [Bacillota bacterium]